MGRKSTPKRTYLDAYNIIKHPYTTERAMKIEDNNTLVFIVDVKSNNTRSSRLSKNCTRSKLSKSTPSSDLTARRRLMSDWLLTTTRWMSPTRLESSKLQIPSFTCLMRFLWS